jgi:subtilase family serine protease
LLRYTDDDFVDWITTVADLPDPPQIFSMSYGLDEVYFTPTLANQFNTEAMKLAAMGVTILVASGDDGATSPNARDKPAYCGYYPDFPASAPYVTAVGATQGAESALPEQPCLAQNGGGISTGGGFSIFYPAQVWNAPQVQAYWDYVQANNLMPPVGEWENRNTMFSMLLAYLLTIFFVASLSTFIFLN